MKVGDYAYFGAFGDFDNATLCKVKNIRKGLFCKEYVLTWPNGNEFIAYEDEVSPCVNNVPENEGLTEQQAKESFLNRLQGLLDNAKKNKGIFLFELRILKTLSPNSKKKRMRICR